MKEIQATVEDRERNGAPRQRQDERSEGTRKRLIDAAFKIILERGCAGLRSAEISEIAGVSIGGQLHHFPLKDTLVAALLERILKEFGEDTERRIAEPCPKSRLLEAIMDNARSFFFSAEFKVALNILMSSGDDPRMAEALRDIPKRLHGPAEDAWVERVAQTGIGVKAAQDLVWFLWGMVHGLAVRGSVSRDEQREARVVSLALKLANARFKKLAS